LILGKKKFTDILTKRNFKGIRIADYETTNKGEGK